MQKRGQRSITQKTMYPNPGNVKDVPSGTEAFETYYSLLGLSPDASPSEIRKAYMIKSLETHPDRNTAPGATAAFQHVADAYSTLSNPYERAEYDRLLQQRAQNPSSPPSWDADPADPEETFASVFEELLRPEVESRLPWWQTLGSVSGATLGFIVGNVPGAIGIIPDLWANHLNSWSDGWKLFGIGA
jgi:hypothetical protein